MDFEEEDQQYLHHHQKLLFHEKLENGTPAERAEITRNILAHLHIAFRNGKISEESYILLQQRFMSQYSSYVDTFDTDTGLNNYADGALALCSLYRNESQKWKSSLTSEQCKKKDWFQKILKRSQESSNHLLPQDKQNTVLIRSENDSNMANGHTLPKQNVTETITPRDPSSISRIQGMMRNDRPIQPQVANNMEEFRSYPEVKAAENFPSFPSHGGGPREDFKRKPLFANNGPSNNISVESNANNFGYNNISNGPQHGQQGLYRKSEVGGMKRPFREIDPGQVEDQRDVQPNNAGPFRTAREQLSIDNQKKYNKGRGQVSTMSYGTAKKSLGTRRGPSSKFVPPVMNKDEDDGNPGACMNAVNKSIFNKGGSNSGGSGSGAGDEPVDERLKGIEPKMIELIMNEIMDHGPQMSWDDIAGLEFAKKTIKEIVVWPMLRPDIFTGLRGPPKGLLLFGPPGTGKTLIGKCIASQSKSTFFSISASSLTSKWVGEAEKMVRAMFAVARCYQPAVVFIDEIDSLLSQRTDGEHEASRRIKTEFLVQLDGAATVSEDRILVIGATNRPQEIDEAARRRFVKRLYIPLPEGSARRQIVVNLLSQQTYQLTEAQLSAIEQRSDGYSGADVANLCREAALGPIRSMAFGEIENISADQVRPILFEDFDAAFMQVRASVSDKDLDLYIDWNNTYGSVPIRK